VGIEKLREREQWQEEGRAPVLRGGCAATDEIRGTSGRQWGSGEGDGEAAGPRGREGGVSVCALSPEIPALASWSVRAKGQNSDTPHPPTRP